jgi:predicted enzyme related to lactoylglutathione lyase
VRITASAISLNVEDVVASGAFLTSHFGFHQEMVADGFVSLTRKDAGMNVVFLRRGLASLPDDQRDDHADGVILAFVVDNLEAELARLIAEGVAITMPLREEPWGERAFQVTDPNGVIVQLVDWNGATDK